MYLINKQLKLQNSSNNNRYISIPKKYVKHFSNIFIYKSNFLAFSLIELSIVLIIIGLLVAGVTGGASLIDSAKVRNLINEFQGIERSVYAFRIAKDRMPGDINNDGLIDNYEYANSYKVYPNNTFKFPYDGSDTANNHYSPDILSAPFVEMYLEGVYDFEPTGTYGQYSSLGRETAKAGGMPFSKAFTSNFLGIKQYNIVDERKFTRDFNIDKQMVYLQSYNDDYALPAKTAEIIDFKVDDGIYDTGKIRSFCLAPDGSNGGNVSYKESQIGKATSARGGKCPSMVYTF